MKNLIKLLLPIALFISCEASKGVKVLATTSVVADAARQLLPPEVEVQALMQSNIDPHSYKPIERDVHTINTAKIVLHNGLHLEGKMTEILEKVSLNKPVYAMSEPLSSSELINVGPNVVDPHIWFDLKLWERCMRELAVFLSEQFPEHRAIIQNNSEAYSAELLIAHNTFYNQSGKVPDSLRAIVTAHDAFSYFGRAYNIQVKSLQGISTAAEFGVKDMSSTANFIIETGLTTVFTETSVNSKSIEALKEAVEQKGGRVSLGKPLYSDALGEQGTTEASLIGAFTYNTTQILNSWK